MNRSLFTYSCVQVKEISENPLARQAISEELEDKKEDVDMETRILEASLKKVRFRSFSV